MNAICEENKGFTKMLPIFGNEISLPKFICIKCAYKKTVVIKNNDLGSISDKKS